MNITLKKFRINDIVYGLNFGHILFILGVFAKQFYLLPSGNLQIGDILMLCSFLWHFLVEKKGLLYIHKDEYYLLGYFLFITVINSVYYIIYRDIGFMKSTLYYIFNIMILLVFIVFIRENMECFLNALRKILQCGLIMQLVIFLGGFGRWYASNRYEGTFNDPNQYGVYIFFSVLIIYITGCIFEKKNWLWMLLGFFLILPSASMGMLVGYFAFGVSFFIVNNYKTSPKKVLVVLVVLVILILLLIGIWAGYIKTPEFISDLSIYKRFFEKLERLSGNSQVGSILSDRGWERVLDSPEFLLFGSGEGRYDRFGTNLEIHSSILGPVFYYGVLPFMLFVCWGIQKFKGLEKRCYCVYVALLVESFFLVNTRQPMFWMIIALAGIRQLKKNEIKLFSQSSEKVSLPEERINNQ